MKDRIEAILFAAGKYVDEDHIAKLLAADVRTVRKALNDLKEEYDKREGTSLQVVKEEKSWKLHVKDTYLDLVSRLVSEKEIATTVLETLAIVAWKNPAMQAEVIKIRGPAAYEHIAELLERGFITKEAAGRSFKLKVTDKFFEYFDVECGMLRQAFKQVEDAATAQQAEVDKKKAEYEAQVEAAKKAQELIDAGKDAAALKSAQLVNTPAASSAHSAQKQDTIASQPSKAEAEKAATKLAQDIKEELTELGEELDRAKDELPKEEKK